MIAKPYKVLTSLLIFYGTTAAISINIKLMTIPGRDADSFDWRNLGVISPVKNQGQMDNSLSFVLAEGVESLQAIQTKQPVKDLSVQEVADCCKQPWGDNFDCIARIGGLCTPETYVSGHGCNNASCTPVAKVTGTGYVEKGREDLMKKVIHQTPLVAFVDAGHTSFQTYVSGVYSDPDCSKSRVDHAVQIVGYGTEGGKDYWIVKNSWGVNWGENGYMRIERGTNMCAIATNVFYPINKS